MPKLFFRKKKKKEKHSIRDAITPSPAFIAVPSTPPPVKESSPAKNDQSSPNKRLEISAPTLLPSNPFSDDITLASKQSQQPPKEDTGLASYSLVGAAEDDEEYVESEAEPGYATVARRTASPHSHLGGGERGREGDGGLSLADRPRLATPHHEVAIEQLDVSGDSPHRNPTSKAAGAGLPSIPHAREQGSQEDFRGDGRRSPSPIARQTVHEGATNDNDVADNVAMLSRNEVEPKVDNNEEKGLHVTAASGRDERQLHVPQETMYSKMVKPRKQEDKVHHGRHSREGVAAVSGDLPPIAPQSSPPHRRGEKDKSRSPRDISHRKKAVSPRDSSSPHQHRQHRSKSNSSGYRDNADSQHHVNSSRGSHHHSRANDGAHVKSRQHSKSRSSSVPNEAYDPTTSTRSTHQHRHRSESYSHTAQPPPMEEYYYEEEDDIDLPLEYTDQSYLGEESDTVTCTESYFHDLYGEVEEEIPSDYVDGSHVTPNRHHRRQRQEEMGHRRSRSATFPGYQQPHHHHSANQKRTASPHAAYYSSGYGRSPPQKRRKRPASSGGMPLEYKDNDIPLLRPPSMQPVYPIPQNQVYVFSELQPDGSMQYYSATPVNSPPIISPPPHFSVPPPLQQAPPTTAPPSPHPTHVTTNAPQQQFLSPSAMNMTPSPLKNVHIAEDGGATARTGANSPLDQAKISRRVPVGITESGYFSSALVSSQQGLATGQAGAVPPVQQERTSTAGGVPPMTNALPQGVLPLNVHLSPNPNSKKDESYYHGHQHLMVESPKSGRRSKSPNLRVSPTAKLLESSLQTANVSSHQSVSPTAKSLRGKSSKSLRLSASLEGGTTATQSLVAGMAVLYEQKERVLKARIKALEDSTVELCTENASLKQLCEALKQDASGSVEQLQRKLSSMLTENQGYREMNRDKDQQLERDKSKIVILKEEMEKLKEENRHLLKAQQSADLERKEWERVSEHAQSVLDENVSLLKQQELLKEQMREMKAQHQAIVSQLNSEMGKGKKEREAVEKNLSSLQESHTHLQTQFDQLVEQSSQQVSINEHQSALKEMHGLLEELEERSDSEVKSQEAQVRILTKEKTSLVTKLTDAKAIILQLEHECTRMHKDLRVAQAKVAQQKMDLEAARDREVAAHDRLSRAVSTAEKAIAERETFARIAKAQQKANERAGIQFALKGATAGNIQKEFDMYKQETDAKLDQANLVMREKERESRVQRRQYQREISHLQVLLKSKQARLDEVTKDKKLAEDRLDMLWRSSNSTERLATLGASIKPPNAQSLQCHSTTTGSSTISQLQGKLSKLNSQVHPKLI